MSAVVKAIKSVANVVLDVVEAVGEVVVDVVDTVVETIEYVAENPEIIVIAVAAPQLLPYIGITGAAVAPVTAGLISASQGGDLEDIGKAALTAYVAPQVGAKVGSSVATATAGSSLQNTLASAAGGAASGATAALIQGGDVGESAVLGAIGSAGASVGRELAAAAEYDVPAFSDQSRQLVSQDVGVNRFSDIGADVGTALGRAAITGDVEGELQTAAQGVTSREVADLLRNAFATSTGSDEVIRAEEALAAELEVNPAFAEQIQLAQIAAGDEILTTDQKIDALAEAVARDAFAEAVAGGEEVAALPALAIPFAANAAINAARVAAPIAARRIAQFAANDPRFAQTMLTNPYTQQLLAAAGLTMTISTTGDVFVEPITIANESPAETARLNRYAAEIAKTVDNINPGNLQTLEQKSVETGRVADRANARDELLQRQADLENLSRQGFPVQRELERVTIQLQQPIPLIDVTQPTVPFIGDPLTNIPAQPGTLPPPTIDIAPLPGTRVTPGRAPQVTPGTAPEVSPTPRPGVLPEIAPVPRPGEEVAPEPLPETAPEPGRVTRPGEEPAPSTQPATRPGTRPGQRLEPLPKDPTRPGTGTRAPIPVEIEDLFTDEDVLDFIRQGLGEDFASSTVEAAGLDEGGESGEGIEAGEAGGRIPATIDSRPGVVGRTPTPVSVTSRAVSTGQGAITGMKEPTFGGDPGQQQDVWNVRSLRLRKALGL
jgi:hypothetical protein